MRINTRHEDGRNDVMQRGLRRAPLMLVFVLVLVSLVGIANTPKAQEFRDIVATADAAVGRVITKKSRSTGTGSGFILSGNSSGLVFLTNRHVIKGGNRITVGFLVSGQPQFYNARVMHQSEGLDLAVLSLTPSGGHSVHRHTTLGVATRTFDKGEEVAAFGFPGRADATNNGTADPAFFESTMTLGNISKVSNGTFGRSGPKLEIVQHTAPINPGNSGGPLIDKCASVVGLNTAVAALRAGDKTAPQGTFWASSGRTIAGFLRSNNVAFKAMSGACNAAVVPAPKPDAKTPETPVEQNTTPAAGDDGDQMLAFLFSLLAVAVLFGGIGIFAYSKTSGGASLGREKRAVAPLASAQAILGVHINGAHGKLDGAALKRGATIGRDPSCTVSVPNGELSRKHAKLTMSGRRLMLEDLGSSNGTKVDGTALTPGKPLQINTKSVVELAGQRLTLEKL